MSVARAGLAEADRAVVANIQALRGIAAMMVVFCHTADIAKGGRDWFGASGANGVDLFFVISGFIMVFTTADGRTGPLSFMRNRFLRIAPLYWLMTLIVLVLAFVIPDVFKGTRPDLREFVLSLAFIPFLKAGSDGVQPMLFVGWTLNYEMFFYALFALGLTVRRPTVGAVGVIGSLVLLALVGWFIRPEGVVASFYTRPITLEFAEGILLGLVWRGAAVNAVPTYLAWIALAVSAAIFALAPGDVITGTVVGYGILAAVIVGASLMLERRGVKVVWPWLLRLGDASYAIYLTHFFVIRALEKVTAWLPQNAISVTILALVAMFGCALVGWVVHVWIERPTTRALKRWWPAPSPRTAVAAVAS